MPAVWAMGRLRYWQKFVVLTILFTIPVGFALNSFMTQIDRSIAFSEKEIVGIQYISPMLLFLQHVQQHRGAASLYRRGDQSFKTILDGKEREIQDDISRVDSEDAKSGVIFQSTDDWNVIKGKWLAIQQSYGGLTPEESYAQHTALISDIIALIHNLGDESNLILDPELPSYEVMNAVINILPALTEDMGQARAFGLSVKDPSQISDLERREFINFSKISSVENSKLQNDIREAFGNDPSLRPTLEESSREIDNSVKGFTALVEQTISSGKIPMALPEYHAFMTRVIDAHFSFSARSVSVLVRLIEHRIANAQEDRKISIEITAASYLLILYFFIGFYLLVARTVCEFEDIAHRLTGGKTEEVPVLSKDELGDVGTSFNTIGRALIASTQDLHSKVNELERFNRLMVDRELKMIELKKEIEELKKQNSL